MAGHTDYTIIVSLTTIYDLSSIQCEALPGVAYPGVRDNRSTLNTKTGYDDDDEAPVSSCLYNGLRGNDLRVSETRRMRCRMEQAYAGQLLADYTRPRRDCLRLMIASAL